MHISFGKNFRDTVPVGREMTFQQFVKLVTEMPRHVGTLDWAAYQLAGKLERRRDKDCRWFIPATFVRPERKADAVGTLSGFVCDFDDGAIDRAEIEMRLSAFSYVAWTSYSHGLDGNVRWRVFIPYQVAIEPSEHKAIYDHFNDTFDGHLDPRCATTSQLWYLPGSPMGAPGHSTFSSDTGLYFDARQARITARPFPRLDRRVAAPAGGMPVGVLDILATRAKDNDEITSRGPVSLRDVISALAVLDPNLYGGYTEWLSMGMAIYDGTKGSNEGLKIFDRWSQKCPGYTGPESIGEKWRSFGGREGLSRVTVASLFKQAQDAGWSPGHTHIHQQPPGVPHPAPPVVQPSEPPKNPPSGGGNQPVPIQLVLPLVVTAPVPPPDRWRAHPAAFATQKKIEDPDTGNQRWVTCIAGFKVLSFDLLKTVGEGEHTAELICQNAHSLVDASFPAGLTASPTEFKTKLAQRGIFCTVNEFKDLQEMIVEWLKKIQDEQRVKQSFTHLGWMEKDTQALGFALGETAFHADGRVERGIKVAAGGGSTIVKHYLPQGTLAAWRSITQFLTTQNRPELMAILSTAFGSPLMKFSGHSGAVVSIVSTASGVGKSTALSLAQSVWGNPKAAMHSAADTVLSLSSKMGFTKDLPAYWDDIKGEKTFEQFASTIYQITQGKEKSRLTSGAELREVQNWNCLAVVAANDSLIEIVRRYGRGTDAGAARIFEIRLEQRPGMTQQATFFDACSSNYGHAGAAYAQWLAVNHDKAKSLVETISARLHTELSVESEERFWVAAIATMLAGAMIAKSIGLVDFDVPALSTFLKTRFIELRSGKTEGIREQGPGPMIGNLIYDHQSTTLRIEAMPFKNRGKVVVRRPPKNAEVDLLIAEQDGTLRVRRAKFNEWCHGKSFSPDTLKLKLEQLGAIRERNTDPMASADPYTSNSRTTCYDIDLKLLGVQIGDTDGDT